jgi:hypothetical protein
MALSLDSMHLKSHFRLAKCLNDLKWHNDADDCLSIFCERFPDYSKTSACENLLKEVSIFRGKWGYRVTKNTSYLILINYLYLLIP